MAMTRLCFIRRLEDERDVVAVQVIAWKSVELMFCAVYGS